MPAMKAIPQPDRNDMLTRWRRVLFYVWGVAAMIAAVAALIAGPIASFDGASGTAAVALISPLAMFVFIVTGLAWLVLLVLSHRSKYTREPPPG